MKYRTTAGPHPSFGINFRKRIITLPVLLSALVILLPSLSTADSRQVTQWRPFLEWSAVNPSWSGNPFDLQASVTFTHSATNTKITTSMFYDDNNTWKWRFTGTLPGEWNYTSDSGDPELKDLTGTVTVAENNVDGFYQRLQGDKWGWTGSNRAVIPNYVMLQGTPSSWDSDSEIDALIDEFIEGHGFTGFHIPSLATYWFDKNANGNSFSDNTSLNSVDTNPDPATFAALEKLIKKTHSAGGAVHFWLWGDSSRTQNLTVTAMNQTGGANGVVDNRLQRYIAARLGPIAGWSVGYGYDLWEWTNESILTTWANFLNSELGWDHFLGARGRKNIIVNSQISENLDYTAYEQHAHLFRFSDWVATLRDRPGKPSFSEDRFRIRNQNRDKDLQQDGSDTRTLLWDLAMAGGIAAIWGNLYDDASAGVSSPYPNKNQLKTYSTFWHEKGYFNADLHVNQTLSSDQNSRILVNNDKSTWILYRRDAESITIDMSGAPDELAAIGVDTKKQYKEITLGTFSAAPQTIILPEKSDWAIRLTTKSKGSNVCIPIKNNIDKVSLICL